MFLVLLAYDNKFVMILYYWNTFYTALHKDTQTKLAMPSYVNGKTQN